MPIDEYSYNGTFAPSYLDNGTVVPGQLLMPATYSSVCGVHCAREATETNVELSVTVPVYIIALIAFVGWFLFTIFVGVGLVALPYDMIRDYARRPQVTRARMQTPLFSLAPTHTPLVPTHTPIDSVRLDSTRLDSTRLDSTRL